MKNTLPARAAGPDSSQFLEMAHVLFMDIVAYSRLPMDEQKRQLQRLQEMVRETPTFAKAQMADRLIRLPTGDGMALVFFGDAEAPVRCALELSRALRQQDSISLRMGIHSGPVYRMADINAARNVAGGAINMAQRVMDCGDAGHILVSKMVADLLGQVSTWSGFLHDLGEAEVKHGVRIHIYNLCIDDAGNPQLPQQQLHRARSMETLGLSRAKRKKLLATTAVVVVALLAGVFYRHPWKTPTLTEKDTIVLADFVNTTGDAVFDDTLKQGLSVQLEQSPFLAIVSERKVNGTLKLMGRPASDWLTPEVTREVCQRAGGKAMVIGSIVRLGSQYVIGLKAVSCDTGDVLAEAQEPVAGKEAVLKALDAAAVTLRGNLGESLSSVRKYATPLVDATTPSLEALKAYSLGRRMRYGKSETAALPFYQRAVEIDPNFALPYSGMAAAYNNLNEVGRAAENATKAYDLREKVSERERFSIEGTYYLQTTGGLEKAAQVYEQWRQTYPRDFVPYGNLGAISASLGNWEKALEESRDALRLEPNSAVNSGNLGAIYSSLNRLDDAEGVYKQADERKLQGELLLFYRYQLAFLKGDTAQMAKLASAAMGKPGAEFLLLAAQADTEAWFGKLKNAREMTRRAMDSAGSSDAKEAAATYQALAALHEVESGNREQARAGAVAAVKFAPNRDVRAMAALALARAGDTAAAETLAADLDKTFPLNTLVQTYWLPTIRAALALQRKDPRRAVELLQGASAIELGEPTNVTVFLCPVYLRGEAYLMLRNGNAAAAEFRKFIDHYGLVSNFPWGALARLGLARAYALDAVKDPVASDKARKSYQDFLTLWKDADPDIPILKQAKVEYAKLKLQ